MKISIHRERTVGQLLAEIEATYGSVSDLEDHVRDHPEDVLARVALHDAREYAGDPEDKRIRETQEVVIPDDAIDQLTIRRLQILFTLKGESGGVDGIRALARLVDRDVKNVSQDVQSLRQLGLVHVRERGKGRAHRVELPGDRIDLHLVEATA